MELTPTGVVSPSTWVLVALCIMCTSTLAAEVAVQGNQHELPPTRDDTVQAVEYPASFFARYKPNSALDMINQIPGFQLDDGDSDRGFASSSGNILINDRRASVKQDVPSAILARIPASQVDRIELLRGQVRDVDLQGRSVVANVILLDVDEAAVRWRTSYRYNIEFGTTIEAGISTSDRWRSVEFNTGVILRDYARGDFTPQSVFDGSGVLLEDHFDVGGFDGRRGTANMNATKQFGKTFARLNAKIGAESRESQRVSDRMPLTVGSLPTEERFPVDYERVDFEIGIDAERTLRNELLSKAIFIYTDRDEDTVSSQISLDDLGNQTRLRVSDTNTQTTETIARVEFVWAKWAGHAVQINLEGAFNVLDNMLLQTEDTGGGPIVVDVPGANSRVEEVRADLLLKDTWSFGSYQIEYGLGGEVSTITQTGDADQERDFSFLKPQFALTYAPKQNNQTRLGVAREVSQLDFNDFVSATFFEDDDLNLGNPDLKPESTWTVDLSHERRFADDGVVKLSVFHDWVSDVEDLLPLTATLEAPGNIGDGRRWGIEVESTWPLDGIGLKGAKLDVNARWQDSSVADPVTGVDRVFTSRRRVGRLFPLAFRVENEYVVTVDFRQDFEAARVAWGWDVRTRGARPIFRVNELDIGDEEVEFNAFVETSRWLDLKIRFAAENILDAAETRDRTVYVAERDLSPVERQEIRDRVRGFRVNLTVSGNF